MNRNFNDIYQKINSNEIKSIKNLFIKRNISVFIFVILIIICWFYLKSDFFNINVFWIMIFITIFVFIFFVWINLKYEEVFKNSVIKKIINLYNSKLDFSYTKGISKSEYAESKFNNEFNQYSSKDLINGEIFDNAYLKMAHVKIAKQETETDENGNTQTTTVVIFDGVYGVVEVTDRILTQAELTPNRVSNKFNKNRIEMDSGDFEKQYDFYSIDKVRAMEIFNSEIIDEINNFKQNTGNIIQIKITHEKLFFKISCGDIFKAPSVKNPLDYKVLHKCFKMIDLPINIISKIIENASETKR